MARAIDGDALKRWCEKIIDQACHPATVQIGEVFLDKVRSIPTLTQPNEPLTIEQLREMDGEPVWIVEQPDWGHWELSADAEDYLANRDQDFYGLKHDDPAGRYGLHVLGWLAYRRPPEGEEHCYG
jgi:hypothetical protein